MIIYTPQMFNTYIECKRKFYLYFIQKFSAPQLENRFLTGKNIHALAAYYLNGQDISIFSLSEKEKILWNNLCSNEYFKLTPVKTEYPVMTKIFDICIGGRIDALVKNDKNDYYILDYKTGGILDNYINNFQTIIYLLCCDSLIKDYNTLNFVYISLKTNENVIVNLSEKLKSDYIELLQKTYRGIKKINKNCSKNTENCNNCPCIKFCT